MPRSLIVMTIMDGGIGALNGVIAGLYFAEGRWGFGIVWVVIAALWVASLGFKVSKAYYEGRVDGLERVVFDDINDYEVPS